MNKVLLVIDRREPGLSSILNDIGSLLSREKISKNELFILSWDNTAVNSLASRGFNAFTPDRYSSSYFDFFPAYKRSVQLLDSAVNSIKDKDLLAYFRANAPYLNYFFAYRISTNINIAAAVLDDLKPGLVCIRQDDKTGFLPGAVAAVARKRGIRMDSAGAGSFLASLVSFFSVYAAKPFKFALMALYFMVTSLFSAKYNPKPGKKRILLIAPSAPQYDTFKNLVNWLKDSEKLEIDVLCANENGYKAIKDTGGAVFLRYGNFVGFSALFNTLARYYRGLSAWYSFKNDPAFSLIEGNGTDIKEYFFEMLKDEVPSLILNSGFYAEVSRNVFNRIAPSLLIATDDPAAKIRTLQRQAKSGGINVVCIPYTVGVGITFAHDIIDKFWVSGNLFKETLASTGIPESKIEIVPVARFKPETVSGEEQAALKKKYGVDPTKKIVLAATNAYYEYEPGFEGPWTYNEYSEWLKALYAIPDNVENVQLIVKPHHSPRDPVALHSRIRDEHGPGTMIITDRSSTAELIKIADVMITWVSMTAIEAIIKDKPVISFNLTKRDWKLPFVTYGAAVNAPDKETLYSSISSIIKGESMAGTLSRNRSVFNKGFFGSLSGNPSQDLENCILEHTRN